MRLVANCTMMGEYGMVNSGDVFEARDEIAEILVKNGNARKVEPPEIIYETQTLTPQEAPEVKPETPFRNVHVSDAESPSVASERHQKLPATDVPARPTRTANSGKRRRRS